MPERPLRALRQYVRFRISLCLLSELLLQEVWPTSGRVPLPLQVHGPTLQAQQQCWPVFLKQWIPGTDAR